MTNATSRIETQDTIHVLQQRIAFPTARHASNALDFAIRAFVQPERYHAPLYGRSFTIRAQLVNGPEIVTYSEVLGQAHRDALTSIARHARGRVMLLSSVGIEMREPLENMSRDLRERPAVRPITSRRQRWRQRDRYQHDAAREWARSFTQAAFHGKR